MDECPAFPHSYGSITRRNLKGEGEIPPPFLISEKVSRVGFSPPGRWGRPLIGDWNSWRIQADIRNAPANTALTRKLRSVAALIQAIRFPIDAIRPAPARTCLRSRTKLAVVDTRFMDEVLGKCAVKGEHRSGAVSLLAERVALVPLVLTERTGKRESGPTGWSFCTAMRTGPLPCERAGRFVWHGECNNET